MELRPYQFDVINKSRDAYRQGFRSPVIVLGCGAGKSFIAAFMAKQNTDRGRRVLFMVHRIEIVRQIVETFTDCGVNMDLCEVGMVQSFTRHIEDIKPMSLIITDEGHHGLSTTYRKIYDAFPDVPRISFTATPCRLDGKPLSDTCDIIIEGVSVSWLIENNFLAPYKYYAPQLADFSDVKKRAGDYDTKQLAAIMSKPKIFGDVIAHYRRLADGKKAICYSPSVQHSKDMCDQFNAAGIPAAHLDGETPADERKGIMQSFRDGTVKILCNNEIIAEGVSVDDCEVCILLRKTASLTLHVQQSMRCMRYLPGKTAIIIDHVGNYLSHGLPDTVREWTLKGKLKSPSKFNEDGTLRVRQCPKCYHTFLTAPICPNCGEPYRTTREEIQEIKNVQLKEIKDRELEHKNKYKENCAVVVSGYSGIEQCRNTSEIMAWCKLNGRKAGYGYHMARIRGFVK